MRLFEDKPRSSHDPARNAESMIEYLDRSARPSMAALRSVLDAWFAHYPAEHRDLLRSRLSPKVTEQVQRSAFWELYLHETFRRAGYNVEVSKGTPDFTIIGSSGRFHVEATVCFESNETSAETQRAGVLHDVLDGIAHGPWSLWGEVLAGTANSAPARKLRNQIERWLTTLDHDAALAAGPQPAENGFERYPHNVFQADGWAIRIEAFPTGRKPTPDERSRAIGGWGSGEMIQVKNEEPLRESINSKARACRNLDAPVIVAVLLARDFGHKHQVDSALYGTESRQVLFTSFTSDHRGIQGTRSIRLDNGLWSRPSGSATKLAGVLVGVRLDFFSWSRIPPTLWTNPFVRRSPLDLSTDLPWHHRWIDASRKLAAGPVPHPAPFFDVAEDWPGSDE